MAKKTPYNGCFKNLDTPEKTYWFGFFVGDGSIGHYGSHYEFYLSSIDKEHVEKVAIFLGYTKNKVRKRKNSNIYKLHMAQKEMVHDLMNLGLTQRKTHTVNASIIPDNYQWDFIRGLFDADGCLYLDKKHKYLRPRFTIVGNKPLLEGVQNIMGCGGGMYTADTATYLAYGGRKKVTKLLTKLYCNEIYLDRKYELYCELQQYNDTHKFGVSGYRKYNIYKDGRSYLETTCLYCGKQITVPTNMYSLGGRNGRFCSHSHATLYYWKMKKGVDNLAVANV